MKKILVVVFAIAVVFATAASAQTPYVAVYFDDTYQTMTADCPDALPGTVPDSAYVVTHNWNMWVNAIEYAIAYPPQIFWTGDQIAPGILAIGQSDVTLGGIGMTWPLPSNGFGSLFLQKFFFFWMCEGCDGNWDSPITVVPYPQSGQVRAVRWPDLAIFQGVGLTSLICPSPGIPVEEKTWGGIKALYE